MSKLGFTAILAATALGLTACGGAEENNMAVENVEDLNASEDLNMGMDMNATDNAMDNTVENAAENNATTNSY